MIDKENTKVIMEKLRDKFLKAINEFCRDNPKQGIILPISTLIGTITVLLSMSDRDVKFDNEIIKHAEKFIFETHILLEKIDNERKNNNQH